MTQTNLKKIVMIPYIIYYNVAYILFNGCMSMNEFRI